MDDKKQRSEERRKRIREAFANGGSNVEVIEPTRKKPEMQGDIYVAAYCRVSTLATEQEDSYEIQQEYYKDLINKKENWKLFHIYADKGKSATSVYHRENFLALMEECKKGTIDLIITKSISRFARNMIDCLTYTRMLKALPHPVGVYFEAENINTLEQNGETMLGILAGFAQRESEDKSTSIKWGIRKRFAVGIPKFTRMYGYRIVDDMPVVVEEEAAVVRYIYSLFLEGNSISTIVKALNAADKQTVKGNAWSYSTIRYILSNERYCGNVTCQKTVTVDMFKHKSVPNNGLEPQYKLKNYHTGIITTDQWEETQLLLTARVQFLDNYEVELKAPIVSSSALNGFQPIVIKEKIYEIG